MRQPPASATDPRTQIRAYVSCGRNLYYVLHRANSGELMLEDCSSLEESLCSEAHVLDECALVRAAPAPAPPRPPRSGFRAA